MTSLTSIQPRLNRKQLEAHWMPYTGNRQFKDDPRMIVAAEGVERGNYFRLEATDTGFLYLARDELVFTPANWDIPQIVGVIGIDDEEEIHAHI